MDNVKARYNEASRLSPLAILSALSQRRRWRCGQNRSQSDRKWCVIVPSLSPSRTQVVGNLRCLRVRVVIQADRDVALLLHMRNIDTPAFPESLHLENVIRSKFAVSARLRQDPSRRRRMMDPLGIRRSPAPNCYCQSSLE